MSLLPTLLVLLYICSLCPTANENWVGWTFCLLLSVLPAQFVNQISQQMSNGLVAHLVYFCQDSPLYLLTMSHSGWELGKLNNLIQSVLFVLLPWPTPTTEQFDSISTVCPFTLTHTNNWTIWFNPYCLSFYPDPHQQLNNLIQSVLFVFLPWPTPTTGLAERFVSAVSTSHAVCPQWMMMWFQTFIWSLPCASLLSCIRFSLFIIHHLLSCFTCPSMLSLFKSSLMTPTLCLIHRSILSVGLFILGVNLAWRGGGGRGGEGLIFKCLVDLWPRNYGIPKETDDQQFLHFKMLCVSLHLLSLLIVTYAQHQ